MSVRVLIRDKGRSALQLYYVDPSTRLEVSRSAGTQDRKEAERAAARWEDELRQFRGADDCGWEYFCERFEDEHLASMDRRTRAGYTEALEHFARLIPVSSVAEVTTAQVSQFKGYLVAEARPLTTVAKILTHLRVALNFASRIGMLAKAPHFDMPKIVSRSFMRGRAITDAEYRLLLEHAPAAFGKPVAPTWRRMIELLRLSGLRLEEGSRLSWDAPPIRVDLETTPPMLVFFGEGQKSRRDETIPVVPELADWLERTPRGDRRGLVAPVLGKRLEPLGWEAIGKGISRIGEAAGIVVSDDGKFASAHDLRRAFGTEWAAKVRPLTLKKLMRHKSLETTLRFYMGLDSADASAEIWGASRTKSRKTPVNGKRSSTPKR
jgi:integrase